VLETGQYRSTDGSGSEPPGQTPGEAHRRVFVRPNASSCFKMNRIVGELMLPKSAQHPVELRVAWSGRLGLCCNRSRSGGSAGMEAQSRCQKHRGPWRMPTMLKRNRERRDWMRWGRCATSSGKPVSPISRFIASASCSAICRRFPIRSADPVLGSRQGRTQRGRPSPRVRWTSRSPHCRTLIAGCRACPRRHQPRVLAGEARQIRISVQLSRWKPLSP